MFFFSEKRKSVKFDSTDGRASFKGTQSGANYTDVGSNQAAALGDKKIIAAPSVAEMRAPFRNK